jgi:NAD(P)-dependent dehydrogenase (short-subunit alcohol dehydrogenase family)
MDKGIQMSDTKRVLITGASAGFGYSAVKALAERGHTVYATMRNVSGKNADKAKELQGWAKDGGYSLHVLELDVCDDASVSSAVTSATANGGIDVLINNAGVGNFGLDEGFSIDQAKQTFETNLFGVMRVNKAVVPHMRKAGSGVIIYISSGVGRLALPFMAPYVASKFAIEGYAEGTSYELAPLGIETVIVQPGAYGTSFFTSVVPPAKDFSGEYGPVADMFAGFAGAFEEMAKAGKMGDPSEIANALVEEVERSDGNRPLRRPVGDDMKDAVSVINQTCEQVQNNVLTAFGLK